MICPHCKQESEIPEIARLYISRYHLNCTVAMGCCGVGVVVKPITKLEVTLYEGTCTKDEWGSEMFASKGDE